MTKINITMMQRISINLITVIAAAILLVGCDQIGSSKIKSLTDLTPKLKVETSQQPVLTEPVASDLNFKAATRVSTVNSRLILSQPAINGDVIYMANGIGEITAYSLSKGRTIWQYNSAQVSHDRSFLQGGIVYMNDRLYVTNGSRYFIILDAKDGREIFRKEFPDIIREKPAIHASGNFALLQTTSNELFGFDLKNYAIVWQHEGGLESITTSNNSAPVVFQRYALVSYTNGDFVMFDIEKGQPLWRVQLSNFDDLRLPSFDPIVVIGRPLLAGKSAYIATSNGLVLRVNLESGEIIWKKHAYDVHSMTMIGSQLFLTNNARQLAAMDAESGRVMWVGELISNKEKKQRKPKVELFQEPFVSRLESGNLAVNVVGYLGQIYQFEQIDGKLSTEPKILPAKKSVFTSLIDSANNAVYLFTKRQMSTL